MSVSVSAAQVTSALAPLLPDWQEVKDASSGNMYYWNTKTNQTSWDRPTAVAAAPSTVQQLPPQQQSQSRGGWAQQTATGRY